MTFTKRLREKSRRLRLLYSRAKLLNKVLGLRWQDQPELLVEYGPRFTILPYEPKCNSPRQVYFGGATPGDGVSSIVVSRRSHTFR
jgi:hypothetical protein